MSNQQTASYLTATGTLGFNMTNDYMFRVVLQKNPLVLKGLICSLLHLSQDEICSAQITNPIELGDDIDDKTFVLDINVLLNNNAYINLEMQVINEHNWAERSLSYLCRTFDQLYQVENYAIAKPVIHIGFLNFHPFPDYPEFYAFYKLMNEKNYMVYSDKLHLRVVDLKHINLATDADKEHQIDLWAKFFTATTWEEIIMFAEENPYIAASAQTLYEANADETTKMKCRARRDYYKQKNTTEKMLRDLTSALAESNTLIAEQAARIAEQSAHIAKLEAQLAQQQK